MSRASDLINGTTKLSFIYLCTFAIALKSKGKEQTTKNIAIIARKENILIEQWYRGTLSRQDERFHKKKLAKLNMRVE